MRNLTPIFLLLLVAISSGPAQTNNQETNHAPDFSSYSQFITSRNIFNPDRYPVRESSGRRRPSRSARAGTPYISLVGTMNYQKGMFAFFDGNTSDYRKVLQDNGQIAGYTVKEINLTGANLVFNTTNVLHLSIGSQLRQNGTNWELVGTSEAITSPADTTTEVPADTSSAPTAVPADSSSAPNDILKRLMQKREQEMK
jgi:hypothetical protein